MCHLGPKGETRERVYAFVRTRILSGLPPSYEEIMAATGIRSKCTVSEHLRTLEREGRITREPGYARAIRLAGVLDDQVGEVEGRLAAILRELQQPAPDLRMIEALVVEAAESLRGRERRNAN